jgi:hypothetical protein
MPTALLSIQDKMISPTGIYPIYANKMAVYGPYHERQLRDGRSEISDDRIDVVGFLRGDNFCNNPVESADIIRKRYKLDGEGSLALYAYSPFRDFPKRYGIACHPFFSVH